LDEHVLRLASERVQLSRVQILSENVVPQLVRVPGDTTLASEPFVAHI
jgi:hypothetical protein